MKPATTAFLSHSSDEAEFAAGLCELLERRGLSCWVAPRDLEPGRPYAEECVRGIDESASFVLLANARAIASVQVLSEVEQAHKRKKPIYTVLIGKPQITRELDYYISRLHWIESAAGASVDNLADRLASVLLGRQSWPDAASPPSLRRTVLYRRDAFMGSAAAVLLFLIVVGGGLAYAAKSFVGGLDSDFRRLGYVSLSAQRLATDSPRDALRVHAQVWLLAQGGRFRDVTFTTVGQRADGGIDRSDRSGLLDPEQAGGVEMVDFLIPAATTRLTVCLAMSNPGLHQRSRVTQVFSIPSGDRTGPAFPVDLAAASDAIVSRDDGAPCQSIP